VNVGPIGRSIMMMEAVKITLSSSLVFSNFLNTNIVLLFCVFFVLVILKCDPKYCVFICVCVLGLFLIAIDCTEILLGPIRVFVMFL